MKRKGTQFRNEKKKRKRTTQCPHSMPHPGTTDFLLDIDIDIGAGNRALGLCSPWHERKGRSGWILTALCVPPQPQRRLLSSSRGRGRRRRGERAARERRRGPFLRGKERREARSGFPAMILRWFPASTTSSRHVPRTVNMGISTGRREKTWRKKRRHAICLLFFSRAFFPFSSPCSFRILRVDFDFSGVGWGCHSPAKK